MRRAGLPVAPMDRTPMAARTLLWALSVALKRLPLVEDRVSRLTRDFDLDERFSAKA